MRFIVKKGSKLFTSLTNLRRKATIASRATRKLVESLGYDEWTEIANCLAGGLSGIVMHEKPNSDWKKVLANHYSNVYFPKKRKSNEELLKRIKALPVVTLKEMNDAVGFRPQFYTRPGGGEYWCPGIGLQFGKDYHIFSVSEGAKFKKPVGAKEITISEFIRLTAKIKQPNRKPRKK